MRLSVDCRAVRILREVLTEVDRLLESRVREQARSVADTTARGDDLTSATVNGIGVELSTSTISLNTY